MSLKSEKSRRSGQRLLIADAELNGRQRKRPKIGDRVMSECARWHHFCDHRQHTCEYAGKNTIRDEASTGSRAR